MELSRAEIFAWDLTEESGLGAPPGSPRRVARLLVDLSANLRPQGDTKPLRVRVLDLSTNGFRIESWINVAVGADVWLRLPGLEVCHAKVAWVSADQAGCEFERPLHPAVLATLVKT